jgi:B12-binding domain/radical SAM domain protein of rhizo-twelve system
MGECEDLIPRLCVHSSEWDQIPSVAFRDGATIRVQGGPHATRLESLPPLRWPDSFIARHAHHHHRFDTQSGAPGAEMETSRGCPYHCTFCAKDNFRNQYRKRPLATILDELDALIAQGVEYVYFVDEIFLPDEALLRALVTRSIVFGVQTRIDLWTPAMLDLLGEAGCVSIEAGVESISERGRERLAKKSRLGTDAFTSRLKHARRSIPFVQANLLDSQVDDPGAVEAWRQDLIGEGVWANKPVPLFPYPGSPEYVAQWGVVDDRAWERAVDHYIATFRDFSDIQDAAPRRLAELERSGGLSDVSR